MSDLLNWLNTAANAATSVGTIHRVGKEIAGSVPKPQPPAQSNIKFTFEAPSEVTVGVPEIFRGTAPPGIVEIYSQDQLEGTAFPEGKDGFWGISLYFSKPGHYVMYARHGGDVKKAELNAYPA